MLSCPGSREAPCARQFILEMLHPREPGCAGMAGLGVRAVDLHINGTCVRYGYPIIQMRKQAWRSHTFR